MKKDRRRNKGSIRRWEGVEERQGERKGRYRKGEEKE